MDNKKVEIESSQEKTTEEVRLHRKAVQQFLKSDTGSYLLGQLDDLVNDKSAINEAIDNYLACGGVEVDELSKVVRETQLRIEGATLLLYRLKIYLQD